MDDSTRPIVEPASDIRQFASVMRQMFVALRNEGFSDREALSVIGQVIAANISGGRE
ncbi:hypothetical protein ACIODS_12145 [Micromonospora chalcea]|uniref:hypothetical protein n=1 Tax=Micromonospora chalcea TaxID=1874 RepID=UPI00381053F9